MQKATVLVADGQELFADALRFALGMYEELDVVPDDPTDGLGATQAIIRRRPDIAIVDFWLSGMDGPAIARAVGEHVPACKVIVLSWFFKSEHIRQVVKAGAVGFLPKSVKVAQVVEALRQASAGESPVYPKELTQLVQRLELRSSEGEDFKESFEKLSQRELEVLVLLSQGSLAEDVSDKLGIALGTTRNHIKAILRKTGARNQAEAIIMARRNRVVGDTGSFRSPTELEGIQPVTDRLL